MDAEFAKTLQEIVNLSDEEKVEQAQLGLGKLLNGLEKGGVTKENCMNFLIMLTKLFVSADRDCTQREYELFVAVTGTEITGDQFFEMTNYGAADEFVDAVLGVLAKLNPDDRAAAILFGIVMAAADDHISAPEVQLIDRIMNL